MSANPVRTLTLDKLKNRVFEDQKNCPYCDSHRTYPDYTHHEIDYIEVEYACGDCHSKWVGIYGLDDIEEYKL